MRFIGNIVSLAVFSLVRIGCAAVDQDQMTLVTSNSFWTVMPATVAVNKVSTVVQLNCASEVCRGFLL